MEWGFIIEKDGTLVPDPTLSEAQLSVLEAKLEVALARVQLMTLEKRLRAKSQPASQSVGLLALAVKEASKPPQPFLSVVEVADLLGIGRSKCYEMIRAGVLPSLRLGRLVRVPREALYTWIGAQGGFDEEKF